LNSNFATDQRCAIVTSAYGWTSEVQLSAHHLARHLVQTGWRVCFLTVPISFMHQLRFQRNPAFRRKQREWLDGGHFDLDRRLLAYTPYTLLPASRLPGLRSSWVQRHWSWFSLPDPIAVLERNGFGRPDLMIMDTPILGAIWEGLQRPRLLYRIVDLNPEHPSASQAQRDEERRLARAADAVIYTSEVLEPYVAALGARSQIFVPSGVDFSHFATAQSEPEDIAHLPRPRAIYVGTIAEWFDAELLGVAAERLPQISFVLIGPLIGNAPAIPRLPNVHFLGPRSYAGIPGYLQHSDVGLIPFRRDAFVNFVEAINPLKLYEYMAAGLPVVSLGIAPLKNLDSPAVLCSDPKEFTDAIERLSTAPKPVASLRAFASNCDWSQRFAALDEHLEPRGRGRGE
jgi:glycosyltransferase involved in cell wall biosynthesis